MHLGLDLHNSSKSAGNRTEIGLSLKHTSSRLIKPSKIFLGMLSISLLSSHISLRLLRPRNRFS